MDVDALTHDERTDRFLFQEFKREGEALNRGQRRTLAGLARKDYLTVWCVRKLGGGQLEWCDVATREHGVITESEYRARFQAWWNNEPYEGPMLPPAPMPVAMPVAHDAKAITADDITWG